MRRSLLFVLIYVAPSRRFASPAFCSYEDSGWSSSDYPLILDQFENEFGLGSLHPFDHSLPVGVEARAALNHA